MAVTTNLIGFKIEGNLIAPDLTADLLAGSLKGQAVADFAPHSTLKLSDEIALAWGDAKAYWGAFQRALARVPEGDPATTVTRQQWVIPLLQSLGYEPVRLAKAEVVDGQTFEISHQVGGKSGGVGSGGVGSGASSSNLSDSPTHLLTPPLHIIGARLGLETRPPSGRPRLSAHALVQEYLNRTDHLWAIVTNGLRWRLLRDSSLMTRLTYVEFDLEQILNGENFAEFGLFYRLLHRSRLPEGLEDADDCLLEFYHQESLQQGGRVRDNLRDGVEKALTLLGTGFLQHQHSQKLRDQVDRGALSAADFYRQLLLIIYRLLFLMVAEGRNLLFVGEWESREVGSGAESNPPFLGSTTPLSPTLANQKIYLEYYSLDRLRLLAEKPPRGREGFQDLWQGLRVTFLLFDENWRGQALGLSPLNGDLFGSRHLEALGDWAIDNADLLQAVRCLSLYEQKGQLRRVNYAALDVEELGSVYESLLDFHPQVVKGEWGVASRESGDSAAYCLWKFDLVKGSDRKTTGSYYTPPELVGQLIKSALEPVIEERLKAVGGVGREGSSGVESTDSPISLLPHSPTPQEVALLSLKVCDPACGSGHFLLAAARRIGKELARVRTGEMQPGPEALRSAVRDVVQHCIYGVDLNPLAVDLCKVALWIEGFCGGMPLNFLDHRIKCGNSLVGVFDLEVLREGIPDNAYTAVTGDDKKLASARKKDNKADRKGQGSIFDRVDLEADRAEFAEAWQALGAIPEETPEQIRLKQSQYEARRQDPRWWNDRTACNLWTAAFFTPITAEGLALVPTTAALGRVLDEASRYPDRFVGEEGSRGVGESGVKSSHSPTPPLSHSPTSMIAAANRLAEELRFFHWPLEFPEVFGGNEWSCGVEDGGVVKSSYSSTPLLPHSSPSQGFDCILGNPPWERIKLQEKEFFGSRDYEIAIAQNKAAREKLIKTLPERKPELALEWQWAKHEAECQGVFIRESGRFLLTSRGDINTYAVFSELARNLIAGQGRSGIIVPTGLATDNTTKDFFGDLVKKNNLASLYDFSNQKNIFPNVDSNMRFSILNMCFNSINKSQFGFFLNRPQDINHPQRTFELTSQEITLLNPNTLTCSSFRTRQDADITKKIYQRVPVLENESTGVNTWKISFMRMFDMSNDSHLFKNESGETLLPLYEAKMFHIYNHRFASAEAPRSEQGIRGSSERFSEEDLKNANNFVSPRYFVEEKEVQNKIQNRKWFLAVRKITGVVSNERTIVSSFLPKVALADSATLILLKNKICLLCCFLANFNSLIFDYVARQKVGGVNLNFFILKQLPILPPETYTQTHINYIAPRVLELTYTAWDLQPFADDLWSSAVVEWFSGGVGEWDGSTPLSPTPRLPSSPIPLSSPLSHSPILHHLLTQWEANHDTTIQQFLSRPENLAGGDELSRYVLSTYAHISQGGAVWDDFPDSEGWRIYTRQHRRGLRQGEQGELHLVPSDRPGIPQGTGNPSDSVSARQLGYSQPDSTPPSAMRENRENVESIHSVSAEQLVLGGVVEGGSSGDSGVGNSGVGSSGDSGVGNSGVLAAYSPTPPLPYSSPTPLPYSAPFPLPPFIWNEDRRAILRAELDAYYAKLYGLTRDELRYILDPADVYGPDFPSETFRVLKNNEIKKYGEYRTQRLVLEAWDKLGL